MKSALRLAIELGRTECVSDLLKLPGIELDDINMMRLCAFPTAHMPLHHAQQANPTARLRRYKKPGRYNFAAHDPLLARGFQDTFRQAQFQIQPKGVEKEQSNDEIREPSSAASESAGEKKGRGARRAYSRALSSGFKKLLLQADFKDGLAFNEASRRADDDDNKRELHVVRKFYQDNLHENYYRTVKPLLHDISPRLELALLADYKIDSADLFIWAAISGHFDSTRAAPRTSTHSTTLSVRAPPRDAVAKLFWQKTKHPFAMAMLASFLCKYVGPRVYIGHEKFEEQAAVMENWVVKSLDCIPEQSIAHELLGRTLTDNVNGSGYTLLDLAMFLGMKKVMAQIYCDSLMEKLWRGGSADSKQEGLELTKKIPWLQLLLHVLTFGFLNPTIYAAMSAPSSHFNCPPSARLSPSRPSRTSVGSAESGGTRIATLSRTG